MIRNWIGAVVATLALCMAGAPALAQPSQDQRNQAELEAAWAAAANAATYGPAEVKLADEATLKIPAGELFVPAAEANRVMVALGNTSDPQRQGLIIARDEKSPWLVDVGWTKEGYVRDGDAKDWQADAMLENLKDGTESENAQRIARGFPALEVTGWVEPPTYDAAKHQLVWSLGLRSKNAPAGQPQTINYNTYALGRAGFFSLDLITGSDTIASDKQVARDLLGSLAFGGGHRYQDFNASTDKVAAYGLAALVGVVAVKKLGLLAALGVFLLKIWKIGLLALAAASAGIRKFFRRKPKEELWQGEPEEAAAPAPDLAADEPGPGDTVPQA
jgi:uncharacterized membrane-anchored protein